VLGSSRAYSRVLIVDVLAEARRVDDGQADAHAVLVELCGRWRSAQSKQGANL
jgi:hypothetical protein